MLETTFLRGVFGKNTPKITTAHIGKYVKNKNTTVEILTHPLDHEVVAAKENVFDDGVRPHIRNQLTSLHPFLTISEYFFDDEVHPHTPMSMISTDEFQNALYPQATSILQKLPFGNAVQKRSHWYQE